MELLAAILCCGALVVPVFAVVVIGGTLARARALRGEQRGQQERLTALGFVPVGEGWQQGSLGGRTSALQVRRGATIGVAGVQGDERMFLTCRAMFEVELAPVGGRISRAGKPRRGPFERVFVPEGGATLDALPVGVRERLHAWTEASDDDLVLVDRDHRWASAGPALPTATVVLQVSRELPADEGALRAWLDDVAARAAALGAP